MVRTTREQRETLKRKWVEQNRCRAANDWDWSPLTYREFRRLVQPFFDNTGCIIVPWCGMWVGIERDGYAHT